MTCQLSCHVAHLDSNCRSLTMQFLVPALPPRIQFRRGAGPEPEDIFSLHELFSFRCCWDVNLWHQISNCWRLPVIRVPVRAGSTFRFHLKSQSRPCQKQFVPYGKAIIMRNSGGGEKVCGIDMFFLLIVQVLETSPQFPHPPRHACRCQHPPWHSYLINREFGRPVLDAEVQVCHVPWLCFFMLRNQ